MIAATTPRRRGRPRTDGARVEDLGILSPNALPIVDHSEPWALGPSNETRPNPDDREEIAARHLRAWIESAPATTRRTYAHGLGWLSHYMKTPTAYHALRMLADMGPEVGAETLARWSEWAANTRGSAARTIRTYRSAIYSGLRILSDHLGTWSPNPGQVRFPTTSPRTWEALEHLFRGESWKEKRDRAVFSLLVRDRFSRKKITSLNWNAETVINLSKLKSKDEVLEYIYSRPAPKCEPLFISDFSENLVNQTKGYSRLSVSGIAKIMQRRTGVRIKPHGIHHFGVSNNG